MGSLDAMPGASPRIASTTSAADAVPEHLANCSISIMFGPPNAPDQNVMAAGVVSKLPKKVLAVIARSNSRTESKIAENSMLICFSSHYWHKNLEKVNQYLTTGDYSPWKPPAPLEIVNKKGRKAAWEPWMAEAADIDDASTTEDTYELFKGELSLYLWACYTRYDELKAHSFQKLQFEFPILGREALHLVEFICYTSSNNLPAEEDMKQFTSDAVEKNKKQVALQPQFTKMFEKAIGNNLAAKLLAGAQRDRLLSLEAESFMTGLKKETGLDSMGRPQRNGNFRFRSNELLIIDPRTPTKPKAMLQSDVSKKRIKSENSNGYSSEEERRARRRHRFRSPSDSPDAKERKSASSPRSPHRKPVTNGGVYGRR
ncbi:hypothetical protein SLS57_005718 [Botryosphaeria dothidea]